MPGSQTYQRLTEENLEEHKQIHFYLDQIMASVEALDATVQNVEPMRRLAAQIQSLRERIVEHQQDEEQGRLYPAILEALPDSRNALLKLRQQHQKMLEVLEMARIHAEFGQPSEVGDLKVDLEHFLNMIREHERTEEDLLSRAIEREKQPR